MQNTLLSQDELDFLLTGAVKDRPDEAPSPDAAGQASQVQTQGQTHAQAQAQPQPQDQTQVQAKVQAGPATSASAESSPEAGAVPEAGAASGACRREGGGRRGIFRRPVGSVCPNHIPFCPPCQYGRYAERLPRRRALPVLLRHGKRPRLCRERRSLYRRRLPHAELSPCNRG